MSRPIWFLPSLVAALSGVAGWMLIPARPPAQEQKNQTTSKRADIPAWMAKPVDSLSRLRQLPYGAERDLATLKLLAACTPEQLKEILSDGTTRMHERSAAVKQWAETDPTGCFAWYRDLTPHARSQVEGYDNMMAVLFRTWTGQDKDAALKAAFSISHRDEFIEAPWEVISAIMEKDLTEGLRLACTTGSFTSTKSRLTAGLWEKDPGAFVKAAGTLWSSGVWNGYLDEGRNKALKLWHERNPEEALATIATLPRDDRARLLPQLMSLTVESSGPVAAAALLATQPAGKVREQAAKNLLETWASTDPIAAIKWMDDHVPDNRSETMEIIIKSAAATQPEMALKITSGLEPGPMRDRAMVGMAKATSENGGSPGPVLNWLLAQPANPARKTALSELTTEWIETSPTEANAYLKTASPGDIPDGLASGLARHHFTQGTGPALAWAQGLSGEQRTQAVSSIFYRAGAARPPSETISHLQRLPAADQEAALQAVLYGAARQDDDGQALATALPANLKALALKQIQAWPAEGPRQNFEQALSK